MLCKLVIPKCMCLFSLGLKGVQMGAHDLKLKKVPFFALKSVNINVLMSAAPKLALVSVIVHLTPLYVLYINLEMSSSMMIFCLFVMFMGSRTNLAWLPERQVWATQIICINPRWPPDAILKNQL